MAEGNYDDIETHLEEYFAGMGEGMPAEDRERVRKVVLTAKFAEVLSMEMNRGDIWITLFDRMMACSADGRGQQPE